MRRLLVLVLLSPLLIADTCSGDDNPCTKPFPEVGTVVTTAEAANDPCAGQHEAHILAWFTQGGVKYPLRCGQRDLPKTSKQARGRSLRTPAASATCTSATMRRRTARSATATL